MADQPRVSIVISNHNYGRFLDDAIGSAFNQTYCYRAPILVSDPESSTKEGRMLKTRLEN